MGESSDPSATPVEAVSVYADSAVPVWIATTYVVFASRFPTAHWPEAEHEPTTTSG